MMNINIKHIIRNLSMNMLKSTNKINNFFGDLIYNASN